MSLRIKRFLSRVLNIEYGELLKILFLTITFFLIIGSYTLTKELKDAVFTSIVGLDRKYLSYAKVFSVFVLIPILFINSKLVDTYRRHQLIYIYSIFFGITGLAASFVLVNPSIGLPNTIASPYRVFGWVFYFFVEAFSPLLLGMFWAFVNSVTSPGAAARNYSWMIAGSKIGGIITAGIAWLMLRKHVFSDAQNLQIILFAASLLLLLVPIIIHSLVTRVPKKYLHGYEAVYQVEKHRKHDEPIEGKPESKLSNLFSGVGLLFKYPYVMGIFGMSFFFELVNQAIKVENIVFGKSNSETLSDFTAFLMWQSLLVHVFGFFVVLFGTRALLETLGEKRSLMLVPTLTGLSIIGFLVKPSYTTAIIAFVVTRGVNYAFAVPLRESLYIPTVKEIKFKTKPWIDGIGSKFAKMTASSFNMYANGVFGSALLMLQTGFFGLTVGFWLMTAYLLGRRFERCVERNEVIGS